MIPQDDFTPHGYLDNPWHSWKLNPSGVVRSQEPLGMGWHAPNLGSYARNQFQYTAHLNVGLKVDGAVLMTLEDFQRQGAEIHSHLHTKNRFGYTCRLPQAGIILTVRYFLLDENALACVITLASSLPQARTMTCYLNHIHAHNPFTSRLWEHGFYLKAGPDNSSALLGLASEGDAFVHGLRAVGEVAVEIGHVAYAETLADLSSQAKGQYMPAPDVTQAQEKTGLQLRAVSLPYEVSLGGERSPVCLFKGLLVRGVSQDSAQERWLAGFAEMERVEETYEQEDEAFWQHAPQLTGDWPASWRHGFVYDLETLRMVMRPPCGRLEGTWDGMQIQAPRTVLAEAALDVLFLSYANPKLASEVILNHFVEAPHPNLPCMREDGSYNMLADDGQPCGTAPEWGFPVWCCDQILRRTGDVQWLEQLYPHVASYLRWWLDSRRDRGGWLVYDCSWESGQDVSSRFGPQQTGGSIIQHVRPVDLQASMAQGARILANWAALLADVRKVDVGLAARFGVEERYWRTIASEFTQKINQMWQRGWFRDFDSESREWSERGDVMHLAPIFCGVADSAQVEQLRRIFLKPPAHSHGWMPLSWPPVALTLIGAALEANETAQAAELSAGFIDAMYQGMDRTQFDSESGLPGVTREYLQGSSNPPGLMPAGIEGYGWGALGVHLLIWSLLGLRAEGFERLVVVPQLPRGLRQPGANYRLGPLPWGRFVLQVSCEVLSAEQFHFHLTATGKEDDPVHVKHEWDWSGSWGEPRTIDLNDPASAD